MVIVALGCNAFQSKGERGTVKDYWRNAYMATEFLSRLVKEGYKVVVTHGNGPQVGVIAEWMMACLKYKNIPPMSLDMAGALTQGWLGYILQQAIYNKLVEKGLIPGRVKGVATIVRSDDPAFKEPTKYIGPWYDKEEAEKLSREHGWVFKPDPRGEYRRVVPSPDPVAQVEIEAIKTLAKSGFVVIADSGSGIPVVVEGVFLKASKP